MKIKYKFCIVSNVFVNGMALLGSKTFVGTIVTQVKVL